MNKELLEQVTEIQKDFVYDEYKTGDYTIYHCHKPGTISYAFEITLGKMGIYVGGDIGSLTYRVARGIDFLSGNDVDYYQHSKLEHDYYAKVELSKKRLKDFLKDILEEALDGFYFGDEEEDEKAEIDGFKTLEEVVAFYERKKLNVNSLSILEKPTRTTHAWDLYEGLIDCDELNEIYRIISESPLYEFDMPSITEHDHSVMFRLYMAHHAATKIAAK
jgi:hypothetical protein